MKLATIARIACTPILFAAALLLAAAAFSQSVGTGVSVVNVNDWGSGYIGNFQYGISAEDVADTFVGNWRLEVGYNGPVQINHAYMSDYTALIIQVIAYPMEGLRFPMKRWVPDQS